MYEMILKLYNEGKIDGVTLDAAMNKRWINEKQKKEIIESQDLNKR